MDRILVVCSSKSLLARSLRPLTFSIMEEMSVVLSFIMPLAKVMKFCLSSAIFMKAGRCSLLWNKYFTTSQMYERCCISRQERRKLEYQMFCFLVFHNQPTTLNLPSDTRKDPSVQLLRTGEEVPGPTTVGQSRRTIIGEFRFLGCCSKIHKVSCCCCSLSLPRGEKRVR